MVLEIPKDVLDRDYHGCGKAWAAVKNGKIAAIRYMGDHTPDFNGLPEWVRAIQGNAEGLDHSMLPTAWSGRGLSRLAAAAQAAGDCPTPPKRDRYRPKELLTIARAAIGAVRHASFSEYRKEKRAELAAIGEVVSGMCSCTEFCVRGN